MFKRLLKSTLKVGVVVGVSIVTVGILAEAKENVLK